MASKHYDIVLKITEVTKLDSSNRYVNGRQEEVKGERIVADIVSLAVKAGSKNAAIDKITRLLEVERDDSPAE